ncbi:PglL family O-oligosaccharyltransferase [Yersinia mollaretii]|uniref:PglL family O-oligosaccharyltransferase n=1 Tax=Yersinia mollaretii TaxID=33060 RepID=UPI0011A38A41|nr:Wzy polymerase domain-containing protein [Yersinia mollaretii]
MYCQKKNSLRPLLSGRQFLPLGLLLYWLIFIIPLYLPNMGGSGLKVPQNIITWAVMAAVVSSIWLTRPANKSLSLTTTARWLLVALIILGIPLLYTSEQWRDAALSRWFGLLGGWVFYVSLLQYRLPRFHRHWLLYALLIATTFQALIALVQFALPDAVPSWFAYPISAGRPNGVFQQVNVLASFIATGLALALMLLLLPTFTLASIYYESLRVKGLKLLLLLFPALLVCLQSRIGWMSGITIAVLSLLYFRYGDPRRIRWAAGLMTAGLLMGIAMLYLGVLSPNDALIINHGASNQARYTMLRDTLMMISQKPLLGWGYGGFEYNFQHFRLAKAPSELITEITRHPHNELLLWWVEGGVVAFIGTLILLGCGLRLIWQALQRDRARSLILNRPVNESLALCLVLLPLVLHTQTEYPFMLSAAHWAIFLLLLAQWDRQISVDSERLAFSSTTKIALKSLFVISSCTVLFFSVTGFYANHTLTFIERHGLFNIEPARRAMKFDPWVNTERWHYDQQTHSLLIFNQTRDPRRLNDYTRWARRYLSHRIDNHVYATWLAIALYQRDEITHHKLRQEAQILFPNDSRFFTDFIYPKQTAGL